jgi:Lipid A 3-O-deacylase (PagL)
MTRGSLLFLALAITLTMLPSSMLRGQDFVPPTQTKGTKDTEIWAGGVAAQHDGTTTFNTDVWMAGARFGRILTAAHGSGWLRGTLQWGVDVVPVFVVTNLQTAYGAEFDPLVGRWNFKHRGRTAPYVEMAGGVVLINSKIPPGHTSRFNIVPSFGFGWQIFRHEQRSIDVGVHAWHLSNAWTAPRNPSANGILFTIGYHWFGLKNQRTAHRENESDRRGGHK